jgi:hypothetical protein
MSVEVKSTSRLKAMLIAAAVLLVGLAIIFGIKYLTTKQTAPAGGTAAAQSSET